MVCERSRACIVCVCVAGVGDHRRQQHSLHHQLHRLQALVIDGQSIGGYSWTGGSRGHSLLASKAAPPQKISRRPRLRPRRPIHGRRASCGCNASSRTDAAALSPPAPSAWLFRPQVRARSIDGRSSRISHGAGHAVRLTARVKVAAFFLCLSDRIESVEGRRGKRV